METKASAPKYGSVSTHVRSLKMTTDSVTEQRFLAAIHEVLASGGTIVVHPVGKKESKLTIGKLET